jgi:hypothetical protein
MILFNLPHPIAAFVDLLERRDTAALLALFAPGAVVKGCHPKYGGQTIEDWNAHDFIGAPTGVHPIRSARIGEKFLLTVLVGYGSGTPETGAACQFDWSFTITNDLMTELIIAPARMPALGSAVAAFVNATNACDLEGLVATFAEDALVNDQLHEHWGRAAIREWAASEMIADKVTILVVGVVDHATGRHPFMISHPSRC